MIGFEERLLNAEKTLIRFVRERHRMDTHRLGYLVQQFRHSARDRLNSERAAIDAMLLKLAHGSAQSVNQFRNTLGTCVRRMIGGLNMYFEKRGNALAHYTQAMRLLDPVNVLKRGYSITYYRGKALTDGSATAPGDTIKTKFFRGIIKSRVEEYYVEE
jgi:exodeoxyribonuclease VII large subunit